ncbi:Flp/Fap pilin component [Pseudomonas aeruginosa]|nr:Flp/Fap pilin component [Pseudomonas aeruginosa]
MLQNAIIGLASAWRQGSVSVIAAFEEQTRMKNLTLFVYCKLRAFLADEEGANAIEYAVIAGLIAVALIAVLSPTDSGIVGGLKAFFDGVGTKVGGLAPD